MISFCVKPENIHTKYGAFCVCLVNTTHTHTQCMFSYKRGPTNLYRIYWVLWYAMTTTTIHFLFRRCRYLCIFYTQEEVLIKCAYFHKIIIIFLLLCLTPHTISLHTYIYVYGRYILLFYARLFLHKSLHIRRVVYIYIVSHSNNIKIYFRHIFFITFICHMHV